MWRCGECFSRHVGADLQAEKALGPGLWAQLDSRFGAVGAKLT
jgi:hypothetical protein